MNVQGIRRLVFVLLALYAVFLTWPGLVPFNRIEPRVLGLPFVLFWIALWVLAVGAGFALLNVAESRLEDRVADSAGTTSHDAVGNAGSGPAGGGSR